MNALSEERVQIAGAESKLKQELRKGGGVHERSKWVENKVMSP